MIGANKPFIVGRDDSLVEIARRGRLGFQPLVAANPGVDPWLPAAGRELVLPYAALLPPGLLPRGITINLAEYRLYLVWEERGRRQVRIYPIGLARDGWMTPEGDYRVSVVIENPLWTIPEPLRKEYAAGSAVIPAGPENPLGTHWIGLSLSGYGIHGTNRPYGIGRRVSHGCVRLYPRDILDLADKVTRGMPVRVIYQPIKVGRQGGDLYLEVHRDFLGRIKNPPARIRDQLMRRGWRAEPDLRRVEQVLENARGIPEKIGRITDEGVEDEFEKAPGSG